MTNTVPQVGRIAIVQLNSSTMAYAQGYSVNESLSVIKEYVLEPSGTPSTGWPAVSAAATETGHNRHRCLYVDNAIEALFETMAAVTVICGPVGSSGGNPKDTYTGYISKVSVTVKTAAITIKKITIDITAAPVHSTW